jgi:hypothetical protein
MFEYSYHVCPKCNTIVHKDSLHHEDEYGDECPNTVTFTKLEVIAYWGICNTASLNVFAFSESNDAMLVAINDNKPEWYEIDSFEDEDWKDKELDDILNPGIQYSKTVYFLDECMKI